MGCWKNSNLARTEIFFATYAICHDPDAWSDPEKFYFREILWPHKTLHPCLLLPTVWCRAQALLGNEVRLDRDQGITHANSDEVQVSNVHEGFTLMGRDDVLVRVCAI